VDFGSVQREIVAQIGGVGEAEAADGHEVVLHLDDHGRLALQRKVKRDFAAGEPAADDDDAVSRLCRAAQIVARFDRLFCAGDREPARTAASGDDNLIRADLTERADFRIENDGDIQIADFFLIPFEQVAVLLLE